MINAAGIALLKEFEGCKLDAYRDIAGVWTIGYGHTGPNVTQGLKWTQDHAEEQLADDVAERVPQVLDACIVEPNDNQLAAMVCLAYNIGLGAFRKSTVLRLHNQSNFTGAASAFAMWNKAGGQVRAGLTRRRASEMALYLTPVDEDRQTKRATPDTKDPATSKIDVGKLAAAVSTAAVGVQTTVSSVSGAWDAIAQALDPRYLVWGLALVAVGATAYFVIEAIQRRKEGR